MKNITGLKCVSCGKTWQEKEISYTCPDCEGNLDFRYDYEAVRKIVTRKYLRARALQDIRKYIPLMPVSEVSSFPGLFVGNTPLLRVGALEREYGVKEFYLKDDTRNPSLSFKDRASFVFLASAVEKKVKRIVAASTGNAGSSLACLAASMGIKPIVIVPKTAPPGKLLQLSLFGAELFAIDGTYDDAYSLCLKITERYGYYNRNTGFNPFTREGKKTVSFEIAEGLNYEAPDYVFVSVGDGNIISGVYKGFSDFLAMKLIDRMPKIICVQSSKSNAVFKAWKNYQATGKLSIKPVRATTIADSISVDMPSDGLYALTAVIESKGFALEVSDTEILSALKKVPEATGVFAEPAAACAFAGFAKAVREKRISRNSRVVCLMTGNGLKDARSALSMAGSPRIIKADDIEIFAKNK